MDTRFGPIIEPHMTKPLLFPRLTLRIAIAIRSSLFTALTFLIASEKATAADGAAVAPTPATEATAKAQTGTSPPAEMVQIPSGKFVMGDKNEVDAPPHEVEVQAFLMDKFLVTQEQYEKLMGDNPSRWKGGKNPVEQVRWSDAVRFCNKRSEAEGLRPCYDLQTWKCNYEA